MTETPQGDPGQPIPPTPQYPQQQYPQQQPYPQQYPAPGQAYPQQQYPGQPASLQYGGAPPSKTNGLALAALIVGVVGLFLCWIPFLGLVVGLIAVVLGFLGMKKSTEAGGRGLAIGGIAVGALTALIGLVFTVITLFVVKAANDNVDDWNDELDRINEEILEDIENGDTEG